MPNYSAIFLNNQSNKSALIQQILTSTSEGDLSVFNDLDGILFSVDALQAILDDEDRHGLTVVTKHLNRTLRSMSSGERMKALLNYLIDIKPDFIILDNPFDNLDTAARTHLREVLEINSKNLSMIQIVHRERDLLAFII